MERPPPPSAAAEPSAPIRAAPIRAAPIRAARPRARPPADVEVSLSVHLHADGRQIVVRRATGAGPDGPELVHIDAVVR